MIKRSKTMSEADQKKAKSRIIKFTVDDEDTKTTYDYAMRGFRAISK